MSRILPLPPEAISGLQSSKHITNLQGVVLSLLENSLDALSNKVEIEIDFRRGGCAIEDNGTGICSTDFLQSGGLGNMYHSSKHLVSGKDEQHGSTGTYLASLGALSLLTVTSKHADSLEAATLSIHQGKAIARHVPAPQSHGMTLSPNSGTRITVRDLFGNMPVRVKQRALAADSGGDDEKAWQELKSGLVALLLAWMRPCSVKLRDLNYKGRHINLAALHPSVNHALTEKSLNELAGRSTKFDLKDVLPILFQANLAPTESRRKWIPLSAASSVISVKGSICLDPAPTKNCQFVSLGLHPCGSKDGHGDLYETVNWAFSSSSFGALEDDSVDIDEEEKDRRKTDRRFKQEGFTRKQVQGRKGVDRWPMFVLQVKFKDLTEKGDRVSEKSLSAVTRILEAAVREWLVANHFRSRQQTRRKTAGGEEGLGSKSSPATSRCQTPVNAKRIMDPETLSTTKKRKIVDLSGRPQTANKDSNSIARPMSSDFSTWSRIKSGRHAFYNEVWENKKPHTAPAGQMGSVVEPSQVKKSAFTLPPLEAGELSSKKKAGAEIPLRTQQDEPRIIYPPKSNDEKGFSGDDFGSIDSEAMLIAANEVEDEPQLDVSDDALVQWTDPNTKQTYTVNSRTGVVLPTRSRSSAGNEQPTTTNATPSRTSAAINTSLTSAGLPMTLSKRPSTANGEESNGWLPGFLKEWNNPVFSRQNHEAIPVASFDGPGVDAAEAENKRCMPGSANYFDPNVNAGTRKLSKTALQRAEVVRQIDRKFILVKAQEGEDEVLVLVDQHAASERVILEGLLEELCMPVDESGIGTTGSKVKTVLPEKPLRFQVPGAEFELFKCHSRHFADWGILYNLYQKEEELSASQVRLTKPEYVVTVKALPPGIAERCTLFPKLLIELLRSEIWAVSSSAKLPSLSLSSDKERESTHPNRPETAHSWLTRIGSCPKGILDLLNSRACRSAIMFNDELSLDQCERLLRDLSQCAFPFMCAHGRVSMVPLVELGSVGSVKHVDERISFEEARGEWSGFVKAFKQWRLVESEVDGTKCSLS